MSLRWDAHTCIPLHPQASLEPLLRYHRAGLDYISVNVGMDMNPLEQVMSTLAGFRASVNRHPQLTLAGDLAEIRDAASRNLLSVGFDLEGALPLLELPEMVRLYRDLGVRQVHLAYNRNNSAASGCHDQNLGLTQLGVSLVQAMNHAGVIVDCSHMSVHSSLDAASYSEAPVVFSHANPWSLTHHGRNITDDQIRAVSRSGGVVCLSGVSAFLGENEPTINGLIRHILYVAELVGVEHVGVGLDVGFHEDGISDDPPPPFDPGYWWPCDAGYSDGITQIRYLPPESWSSLPGMLRQSGMSTSEVDGVLGENMARVLAEVERCAI